MINMQCYNMYIVHAPWGDLLNVWREMLDDTMKRYRPCNYAKSGRGN
jgi:hypothetical protein